MILFSGKELSLTLALTLALTLTCILPDVSLLSLGGLPVVDRKDAPQVHCPAGMCQLRPRSRRPCSRPGTHLWTAQVVVVQHPPRRRWHTGEQHQQVTPQKTLELIEEPRLILSSPESRPLADFPISPAWPATRRNMTLRS